MRDPPDDQEISTMEEIDTDPRPNSRSVLRRETILGLLLILGVLTWSGWQWQHQEYISGNYRAAQQAVTDHRLDDALSLYKAAGTYRDASSRAEQVDQLISQRASAYNSLKGYVRLGYWLDALREARAVTDIDPDYQDAAQMASDAESRIYSDAVRSTIALRTDVDPPGLYYRYADRWEWLPGSDRSSRLVYQPNSSSLVVYDVPGPNWLPPQDSSRAGPTGSHWAPTGSSAMAGRVLMSAQLTGNGPVATPWSFDPAYYDFFRWGDAGMWAFHYETNYIPKLSPWVSRYMGYDLVYQPFGSSHTLTTTLPGPDWVVMDVDPTGEHLLLADIPAPVTTTTSSRLFITGPSGLDAQLIYTQTGGFHSAQFSPQGDYVLVTGYAPYPDSRTERDSAVLIDLHAGGSAVTLAEKLTPYSNRGLFVPFGSTFLSKAPDKQLALVGDINPSNSQLMLFDVANPGKPMAYIPASGAPYTVLRADQAWDEGPLVFAWQSQLNAQGNSTSGSMNVVEVTPGRNTSFYNLPQTSYRTPGGAWLRDKYMLISSYPPAFGEARQARQFSVDSVSVSEMAGGSATATPIYTATLPTATTYEPPTPSDWNPGSTMLAYIGRTGLRARAYGGTTDVPLESGVTILYGAADNAVLELR